MQKDKIEDLEVKGLKIIQNKEGYCFTNDAVLLANFVKAGSKDILVDLGCGSGIITIIATVKNNVKKAYGIEIQNRLANMATKSVELNNLQDKIQIINSDIKDVSNFIENDSASVVVSNPPYWALKGNKLGKNEELNICRLEVKITLKELIKATQKLLKFGGKFYMVHEANRLSEIMLELKQNKLEPKVLKFVRSKKSNNAHIVLIEAIKGGKVGLKVQEDIILLNEDGTETEQVKEIYGK